MADGPALWSKPSLELWNYGNTDRAKVRFITLQPLHCWTADKLFAVATSSGKRKSFCVRKQRRLLKGQLIKIIQLLI